MIYFGFSNKDNQNCKERDNSFFVKHVCQGTSPGIEWLPSNHG